MKHRLGLIFCLLLAGCTDTDWDHVLRYGGLDDSATAAPARPAKQSASPAAVSAPPAEVAATTEAAGMDFCRSVATQDATRNGFDPATQQRVYAQSYAQCAAMSR